jgi:hypothetical protein
MLVGATTAAQSVTVTNNGNMPLTFTSVSVSGDYAATDDCTAAPIAAGSSCTVNITFTPTATGTRTGTLTFTNDADNSPQTVSLSGKGEYLQISGTTSQTVSVKSTATYPLTLTAATGLSGTVNLTCSGAPARTTCNLSNNAPAFTAGGNANVTVTVVPAPTTTASANHAGQIYFAMFGLFGVLLMPVARKKSGRKVLSMVLLALMITASVGGMVACGGDSKSTHPPPPPTTTYATPGTYTVTITATSGGNTLQTQNLTLTLQ